LPSGSVCHEFHARQLSHSVTCAPLIAIITPGIAEEIHTYLAWPVLVGTAKFPISRSKNQTHTERGLAMFLSFLLVTQFKTAADVDASCAMAPHGCAHRRPCFPSPQIRSTSPELNLRLPTSDEVERFLEPAFTCDAPRVALFKSRLDDVDLAYSRI
jgi:hypothetical protein